jgi:thiol:disulfide interchange protein
MSTTIIGIESIAVFNTILKYNQGLQIIKLGATWCKPCQHIGELVQRRFSEMNKLDFVNTYTVNIDDNPEIYNFLRRKKMLIGIPAILMYKKGNLSHVCDELVNSSDLSQIDLFFERCLEQRNNE